MIEKIALKLANRMEMQQVICTEKFRGGVNYEKLNDDRTRKISIGGNQSGLHDVKQNNTFDFGSDFVRRYLQNAQYTVLSDF